MAELHPSEIRIIMDLPRLGELIATIAERFAELREIEPLDPESEEGRELAIAAWERICFMVDRAEFARSVNNDLEQLEVPQHEGPIGWMPPV